MSNSPTSFDKSKHNWGRTKMAINSVNGENSSRFRAGDGTGLRAPRRLSLLIGAILASLALLCVAASSASAQPLYGLQFSTFTTDGSEWEAIGHSGASVYRLNATWKVVSDAGNWRESPAWEQTYDKYFELAANHGITILPDLYGRRTEAAIHQLYLTTE